MRYYAGGLMTEPRLRDRTLDESILPDAMTLSGVTRRTSAEEAAEWRSPGHFG
jgi:hypothetical protein